MLTPRLVPERPLPTRAYIPGQTERPAPPDASGPPHPMPSELPNQWRSCADYLHGIDLFNHGFYWEAHEAWEGPWHACGRKGATADFLKGLIHLAAAGVKVRQGRGAGVRSHARRAAELFAGVAASVGSDLFLGLPLAELIALGTTSSQNPSNAGAAALVSTYVLTPR